MWWSSELASLVPPLRCCLPSGGIGCWFRGAGWALVGDAGLFVDPLSTHGITDAMRDAELLSRAADAMFNGEDEVAALAGYQINRDRIAQPLFGPLNRLAGYQWTLPEVQQILRENSKVMVEEARVLSALTI